MIFSDVSTQSTVTAPAGVPQHVASQTRKPYRQKVKSLHYMTWVCLFLACLGASWFSYQYFLVPQPKSFAPDWQGAQWVQAADGNAPVAYFRSVTDLNVLPDGAFVTVAANQVFSLYVNGNFVGENTADFVAGIFPRAYMYDIAPALQPGPNVIALRVANVDKHTPIVRVSVGIIWGKFISYYGTGNGWQATAQSAAVYPLFTTKVDTSTPWATNTFDASSWLPAQEAATPPISPILTVNPLLYKQPIATRWISAGAGHDAYFLRQLSLPDGMSGAWLRIAATGIADIFINGQFLITWNGQARVPEQNLAHFLSGKVTIVQHQGRLAVGIYDISPFLHPGVNTIAAHVAAPGVSAARVELDTPSAAASMNILISGIQGHNTWFTPGVEPNGFGWHASDQPVDGWTQGSNKALAWPQPILIGRPGAIGTFYLPGSDTQLTMQFIPLSLLGEMILFSTGVVLGAWLLMSLFVMRRYYTSRREALETMSLAYLPAVAFEGILLVLSREPLISQPFPYTQLWGLVLILLVGVGYILLWLNTRSARLQLAGNQRRHSQGKTLLSTRIRKFIGVPLTGSLPLVGARSTGGWHTNLQARISGWLRIHWALVPLVLLAIPLICYNLSYEPYWQDEWTSFYAAKGVLTHGIPVLSSGFIYLKGELYSYLLALSMVIFGDQGGAPRIVSVVEYLLSLPLLYGVGCYFFDRRIALLATAMLALSPIALRWGHSVRMYEQAQLLTILVVYLFYKALQERQRVRWVYLACISLLVAYLSHEETFIILPAITLWVLVASRDGTHRLPTVLYQKHWWYAALIAASGIALQLLLVYITHPPILGTDQSQRPLIQFTTDNVQYYTKQLFFPTAINTTQPWITVNSLLATVGCIWALRHADRRAKYCALFLLISFFTLVFVFTLATDRYIYPLLPIYYLMGAYALLTGLRALWAFARSHIALQQPGQPTIAASRSYLSKPMKIMAASIAGLVCASVLVVPMLPISGYNIFVSQQAGLPYHRHFPDYDAAGRYVQQHWRKGDVVIMASPAISVLHYVGHIDYLFSIDRALYLFERNGHIVDTPTGAIEVLFNQQDFQAVLERYTRVWIISDNGGYQSEASKRFKFPPDLHIVYEGYGSAVYFRGSDSFQNNKPQALKGKNS